MIEADLRLRAVVPAPPKTVYEALTDPAALRVWLAEHADVQLPGKYEFWGRYTPDGAEPHQRVLHVDERTIRFAWTVDGVETQVEALRTFFEGFPQIRDTPDRELPVEEVSTAVS